VLTENHKFSNDLQSSMLQNGSCILTFFNQKHSTNTVTKTDYLTAGQFGVAILPLLFGCCRFGDYCCLFDQSKNSSKMFTLSRSKRLRLSVLNLTYLWKS